jgi:hypothetical protein
VRACVMSDHIYWTFQNCVIKPWILVDNTDVSEEPDASIVRVMAAAGFTDTLV